MSNITVVTIEKPQPPNEEKGYKGRNSYKIVDENNISYFAQPTLYNIEHLKEGDEISIEINEKNYSGKTIRFLNKFTILNNTSSPEHNPMKDNVDPFGNDIADLKGRDWAIILQACVNRHADWTPDQKLQWIILNYSRGSEKAFKHLQQTEDLDNQSIEDDIPNNF